MSIFLLMITDKKLPDDLAFETSLMGYKQSASFSQLSALPKYLPLLEELSFAKYIYSLETNINIEKNILAKNVAPELYESEIQLFNWLNISLGELLNKSYQIAILQTQIMEEFIDEYLLKETLSLKSLLKEELHFEFKTIYELTND